MHIGKKKEKKRTARAKTLVTKGRGSYIHEIALALADPLKHP